MQHITKWGTFFTQFKAHDSYAEIEEVLYSFNPIQRIVIYQEHVTELFKQVKISKAQDPGGICGRALCFCANQFEGIFQCLFQHFLGSCSVPSACKSSTIVLVLKKDSVQHLDYRSVALASLVIKALEKNIKHSL